MTLRARQHHHTATTSGVVHAGRALAASWYPPALARALAALATWAALECAARAAAFEPGSDGAFLGDLPHSHGPLELILQARHEAGGPASQSGSAALLSLRWTATDGAPGFGPPPREAPLAPRGEPVSSAPPGSDTASNHALVETAREPPSLPAPTLPGLALQSGRVLSLDRLPWLGRQTVQRTLHVNQQAAQRERLGELARRARRGAALPALRLRLGTSADQSRRMTPTTEDPGRFAAAGSSDLWVEAQATWQLDRLLFASDELQLEKLRRDSLGEERQLVQTVLAAFGRWLRAGVRAMAPELSADDQLTETVAQAAAQAELDVLTGGWFSEQLGATE